MSTTIRIFSTHTIILWFDLGQDEQANEAAPSDDVVTAAACKASTDEGAPSSDGEHICKTSRLLDYSLFQQLR